jgi:DNA helicase-2/ATP-dependent DNA helicase PcrA
MSGLTEVPIPWEELNEEQRDVVATVHHPVLVMAPVGTGKTRALTLRAANAIASGVPAEGILCLSFTNKAAEEVRERLTALFRRASTIVTTRTFHSLCASILRAEAAALGIDADFVIYDEEDAAEVLERIWRRRRIAVPAEDATRFASLLFQCCASARLTRYDDVPPLRPAEIFESALRDGYFTALNRRQNFAFPEILKDYVHELRHNRALDFADLVVGVCRLWEEHPASLARWQQRFRWIQVDEVQDTSRSEYRIISRLAEPHRQLSFFGDIDQTIYEWRGSAPFEILDDYKRSFQPVREIRLIRNYRSTRQILDACAAIIHSNPKSVTTDLIAQVALDGDPVAIHEALHLRSEAEWIAGRINRIRSDHGVRYRDVAVLTRTNFTARDISREFERLGIPHFEVDQMKFFQRAEIKNALAPVRLLLNPFDGNALHRYLKTPPKGIGDATINSLMDAPRAAGLKLGDLLDTGVLERGDPFAPLLEALSTSSLVVFDLETTGLEMGVDEIVELAAVRCGRNGIEDRFHRFVRPSRPVGASADIHGLSDDFLAVEGVAPADALREFVGFSSGCVLAGHNVVSFDLPFLQSALASAGTAELGYPAAFDTLDLCRRFFRFPRYTLSEISRQLHLAAKPSHRAGDDVAATAELVFRLLKPIQDGVEIRRDAIAKHGSRFIPLADQFHRWRERMPLERPAEMLARALDESGLVEYYERTPADRYRVRHLAELGRWFERRDQPQLRPADALIHVLNQAALGVDMDRMSSGEDRVLIVTVHQAKGLEFDTVFVASASDGEFPSRRSVREGRTDEELRLFYVAASRARRRLIFSYSARNGFGRPNLPSPFLRVLQR